MGVKNPMQNDEVKEKLRDSVFKKYGVSWFSKSKEWSEKFKRTSLERWGYDNPSKNPEIIKDIRKKYIDFLTSKKFRKISKTTKQRNTWRKYEKMLPSDYKVLKYDTDVFTITHLKCKKNFEITKGLLYTRLKNKSIICTVCNEMQINRSSFEIEVGLFLEELNIKYLKNDRTILNGVELDYFLPDFNIAIECNGVYWHNELFKSKKYHLNKTMRCREKSINLIHIWEDDWLNKQDIIKSIIRNRLGLIGNKIWARNCKIREVSTFEYKKFLNSNHIQNYSSSSYNIGLYHKEELVSLMTFGWRRTNNKKEYELIRFCNKIDTSVVGSASKLFKHFLKNVDVSEVVSYSDISLFSGNLYKNLGFKMIGQSEPNYFWVVNGVRRHRYNFSKRKLVKEGYDPMKTEVEIMNDRGHWRIFSTGQEKWLYTK